MAPEGGIVGGSAPELPAQPEGEGAQQLGGQMSTANPPEAGRVTQEQPQPGGIRATAPGPGPAGPSPPDRGAGSPDYPSPPVGVRLLKIR